MSRKSSREFSRRRRTGRYTVEDLDIRKYYPVTGRSLKHRIKAGVAAHATAYEHRQKARRNALLGPRINQMGIKQRSKKKYAARENRDQRLDDRFDDAQRQKLPAELPVVVWVDFAQECNDTVKGWVSLLRPIGK
jgi:hypothetical protein